MIDDEPLMTRFVAQSLKRAGFENVVCLNNPQDALAEISRLKPDLVLLDIVMPGISGLDLRAAIKNDSQFADISILMLSAANKKSKYESLNLGAVDFINKPVDAGDLVKRVRKALRVI